MLRKYLIMSLLTIMMIPMLVMSVKAASITDMHWVTRNDAPIPFVRMVLSLTDPAAASAEIDKSGLSTTVTVDNSNIEMPAHTFSLDPTIVKTVSLLQNGNNVDVKIQTPASIDVGDMNVFTLKKDVANNKPFRLVIDVKKKGVAPRDDYYGSPKRLAEAAAAAKALKEKEAQKQKAIIEASQMEKEAQTKVVAKSAAKPPVKPAPKQTPEKAPMTPQEKINAILNSEKKEIHKPTEGYRVGGGIKGKIIVIDPGHGGSDSGAIGPDKLMEKNVTLPIAKYLTQDLEAAGAHVVLSRTSDVDVFGPNATDIQELQARADVGNNNNADMFISVHINSFTNPTVGGVATYYFVKTPYDKKLASDIQAKIGDMPGFAGDRGIQEAGLYVLRHTTMPAVLVELGFISNPTEEHLLMKDETREAFAKRIAEGIISYFGG